MRGQVCADEYRDSILGTGPHTEVLGRKGSVHVAEKVERTRGKDSRSRTGRNSIGRG